MAKRPHPHDDLILALGILGTVLIFFQLFWTAVSTLVFHLFLVPALSPPPTLSSGVLIKGLSTPSSLPFALAGILLAQAASLALAIYGLRRTKDTALMVRLSILASALAVIAGAASAFFVTTTAETIIVDSAFLGLIVPLATVTGAIVSLLWGPVFLMIAAFLEHKK